MKILRLAICLFLLSAICMTGVLAYAAVPHLINYQGRLTDGSGVPLSGLYSITFRIYDAENAGNLLWQGTYSSVSITKGVFNILLGDVNDSGFNFSNLAFDKPYWLEIKVGADNPMQPRQRISSSGYAIKSESADKVKAEGIIGILTGSSLPSGSILQVVHSQSGQIKTCDVKIPLDNSVPMSNEGTEVMSLTVTPSNANNKLKVDVVLFGTLDNSGSPRVVASLFQDSGSGLTTEALAVGSVDFNVSYANASCIAFSYYGRAGSVSPITFKVRAGTTNASSTFYFNGNNNGEGLFGGKTASSITITEIKD